MLRQQVAQHEIPRIELIREEPARRAAEPVTLAARVGRAERHRRGQRELHAGVPVLIARRNPADLRIAVGDAAAGRTPGREAAVQRRVEERRRGVRRARRCSSCRRARMSFGLGNVAFAEKPSSPVPFRAPPRPPTAPRREYMIP